MLAASPLLTKELSLSGRSRQARPGARPIPGAWFRISDLGKQYSNRDRVLKEPRHARGKTEHALQDAKWLLVVEHASIATKVGIVH